MKGNIIGCDRKWGCLQSELHISKEWETFTEWNANVNDDSKSWWQNIVVFVSIVEKKEGGSLRYHIKGGLQDVLAPPKVMESFSACPYLSCLNDRKVYAQVGGWWWANFKL